MDDTYLTLGADSEGLYKEKGSKFIALAWPVQTEAEIEAHLEATRKRFHDARHVCYAWRLGPEGKRFRANDDGEPSHSAGDPILGELRSRDLKNVLVAVVRYFGGTKLGVGGLIRAYSTAAGEALDANEIKEVIMTDRLELRFAYERTSDVNKALHPFRLEPTEREYGMDCRLIYDVRQSMAEKVRSVCRELGILVEDKNETR